MPSATRATAERIISEKTAAGDAAAAGGNYPAAVLCYSAALKMRSSAELLTKRARCHEVLADHLAALGDLSLLCRLEPANWSHRLGRASLFRELGQLTSSPGALLDLDEAVSLAATAPERERSALLSTRAGVREEAAQWGEAVEDYSLLLELLPAEPADKTAAAERARVQLRRGCCGLQMHAKSESGMRDLLAVVELAPSLPDARLQLGRALRQMGEFAAADIELAEGLTQAVAAHRPSHDAAHHPLHAALLRERARVLCCLRRPEEALPLLRKACEAEPAEAAHTLALGAAMLQVRPAPLRTCTAHPHCCPPALRTRTPHPRRPAACQTTRYVSPQAKQPEQALEAYESAVKFAEGAREGVHDVPPTRPAPLELWTAMASPRAAPQPAPRVQLAGVPHRTSPQRTGRPSSAQPQRPSSAQPQVSDPSTRAARPSSSRSRRGSAEKKEPTLWDPSHGRLPPPPSSPPPQASPRLPQPHELASPRRQAEQAAVLARATAAVALGLHGCGRALLAMRRAAAAARCLDGAIAHDAGRADSRLELAVALLALRQPQQAAAEADAAVMLRPAWFAARELRAQLMLRLGRDAAALADCYAALECLDAAAEEAERRGAGAQGRSEEGEGGDGGGSGDDDGGGGSEEVEVPPLAAEVTASRSRVWELMSHALLALERPAEALDAAEAAQREYADAGPPPLRLRLARAEAMRALGRQPDALQALGRRAEPWTPDPNPDP